LIILELAPQGGMIPKNKVTDYMAWGEALATYNIIQFFTLTYQAKKGQETELDEEGTIESIFLEHKRSHPKHDQIPYESWHSRVSSVQHIIQEKGHNNLPNFIGVNFSNPHDPETFDVYSATMLMLLKP